MGGATGECLKEASTFSSGPSLVLLASAAAVKADPRRLGHEKRRFWAKRDVKPNLCFFFVFGKDFFWIFVNLGSFNHWRVLLNPQILFPFVQSLLPLEFEVLSYFACVFLESFTW